MVMIGDDDGDYADACDAVPGDDVCTFTV